ncbi:unnamed protein product [Calypogeia fissa]
MARVPIPARSGAFVNLKPGQRLKIVNTHGTQVVDTWALSALADDYHATTATSRSRYLSMCHTRTALGKLSVATNDILRDNIREPMLKLIEDTSGGVHDLLFAACDAHRYAQLGVDGKAGRKGSRSIGLLDTWIPDPLNLFMNVPVTAVEAGKGGKVSLAAPTCPIGGYVVLRAETECVVIMSACPMDLTTVYETRGAEYEILDA